ncbi:Golgi apparatus membrane protein TVP15 [Dipodascopsis tothii]|uniref:Golgi apparatus membrane protein TVP15 n=1 Tax=Dipodascopsis tothii TaxID=44089 RepID=UPI0034CE4325
MFDDIGSPFRIVNFIVGALMVLGGISMFFPISFRAVITAIYTVLFGAMVILAEFALPENVIKYASFLLSFLGRGLFYLFVGATILAPGALRIVAGSIAMIVGVVYIILEFAPIAEAPANMRSDEPGYEQTSVGETV